MFAKGEGDKIGEREIKLAAVYVRTEAWIQLTEKIFVDNHAQ